MNKSVQSPWTSARPMFHALIDRKHTEYIWDGVSPYIVYCRDTCLWASADLPHVRTYAFLRCCHTMMRLLCDDWWVMTKSELRVQTWQLHRLPWPNRPARNDALDAETGWTMLLVVRFVRSWSGWSWTSVLSETVFTELMDGGVWLLALQVAWHGKQRSRTTLDAASASMGWSLDSTLTLASGYTALFHRRLQKSPSMHDSMSSWLVSCGLAYRSSKLRNSSDFRVLVRRKGGNKTSCKSENVSCVAGTVGRHDWGHPHANTYSDLDRVHNWLIGTRREYVSCKPPSVAIGSRIIWDLTDRWSSNLLSHAHPRIRCASMC